MSITSLSVASALHCLLACTSSLHTKGCMFNMFSGHRLLLAIRVQGTEFDKPTKLRTCLIINSCYTMPVTMIAMGKLRDIPIGYPSPTYDTMHAIVLRHILTQSSTTHVCVGQPSTSLPYCITLRAPGVARSSHAQECICKACMP